MKNINPHEERAKFAILLLVVAILCALVGYGFGLLAERANAAPPQQSTISTSPRCATDTTLVCPVPTTRDRRAADKYRTGAIAHAQGVDEAHLWAAPARAERFWVDKIAAVLATSPSRAALAKRYIPNSKRCDRCLAYELYREMMTNAGCTGSAPYPVNPSTCTYPTNTRPFTMTEIKAYGGVIICGGSAAISLSLAPATEGLTLIATTASVSCIWGFWAALH